VIIDPDLETWLSKKAIQKWNTLQKGVQHKAVKRLKPALERQLQRVGLEWADIEPYVEQVESAREVQEAIEDPDKSFMDKWLETEIRELDTTAALYVSKITSRAIGL
jgi:hypothetical protein